MWTRIVKVIKREKKTKQKDVYEFLFVIDIGIINETTVPHNYAERNMYIVVKQSGVG